MKYNELMERIKVTPEMRGRVLANLNTGSARRARSVRRFCECAAALAACAALVFALWTNAARLPVEPDPPVELGMYGAVECASADELSQALGFAVKVPQVLPFAPESIVYEAMFGEFSQITCTAGGAEITARMARGTDDVSGDYNVYAEERTVEAGGCAVLLKGDAGKISLAVWTDGEFAYSVSASPAISQQEMLALIESMQ